MMAALVSLVYWWHDEEGWRSMVKSGVGVGVGSLVVKRVTRGEVAVVWWKW